MSVEFHKPTYRPLTRCGHEELAMHLRSKLHNAPSGGIAFARKPSEDAKHEARAAVLYLLNPGFWPGRLSVLTMPGLKWKFEGALLKMREQQNLLKRAPLRTSIDCIENDRSIYHAAAVRMPGMRHPEHVFRVEQSPRWAERAVSGWWINRYFFGNVDNLMADPPRIYDVAWLDYTGPLSVDRMAIIRRFFELHVRSLLVVTSLKARWNRETSAAIERAGGCNEWTHAALGGGPVAHAIEYQDGPSPMAQLAVWKGAR